MSTTTLRGGQVVPVQVAHSLAPSWGVSCPYCGARNDAFYTYGMNWRCRACLGEYTVPAGALIIAQVRLRGTTRLLRDAWTRRNKP